MLTPDKVKTGDRVYLQSGEKYFIEMIFEEFIQEPFYSAKCIIGSTKEGVALYILPENLYLEEEIDFEP